jgi:hypothetical protein
MVANRRKRFHGKSRGPGAPNQPVRVGAAAGSGLQCCLGQAAELFFAKARRTADSFMASINEIARMCRRF